MEKKGAEKAQAQQMNLPRSDSGKLNGLHLIFSSQITVSGASANPFFN
jgi:hypothetical protein